MPRIVGVAARIDRGERNREITGLHPAQNIHFIVLSSDEPYQPTDKEKMMMP
jgi:hypothetical protein